MKERRGSKHRHEELRDDIESEVEHLPGVRREYATDVARFLGKLVLGRKMGIHSAASSSSCPK